ILNNATNNDTVIDWLADQFNFFAPYRQLRCTCHIFNLAAQTVIFSKDKNVFGNENKNLAVGTPL
ncbi:hypothetical protein K469DRAFT_608268, partial [Zopfia rhizophila CBS 207.26]